MKATELMGMCRLFIGFATPRGTQCWFYITSIIRVDRSSMDQKKNFGVLIIKGFQNSLYPGGS